MKHTRFVSLLLALLVTLPLAAACSETTESGTETTAPVAAVTSEGETTEEETKRWLDNMPEKMDFEGRDIRFVVVEGGNGNLSEQSITAPEDSADVVDSAVYDRNLAIMERLNVNIVCQEVVTDWSAVNTKLTTAVAAGTDDLDVVGTYQYYGIKTAADGNILNLTNQPNLDLTQNYWGVNYIENMSYKGAKFWATGDLALRYIGGMYVSYVNTDIWNSFYSSESVYNVVRDGKWTLDYVREKTEGAYLDLNGNSKVDLKDQMGLLVNYTQDPMEGIAAGSLIKWSEIDADGNPVITLNSERTITFWEKVWALFNNNSGTMLGTADDSVTVMQSFAEGTVMMTINKLFQSGIYLREMEDDFYILPVPKLDEAQDHYNTMLHDGVTLFGIPIVCSNVEAVTATLEALAAESHQTVLPAYYDTALKVKYSRDTESGEMIDMIHDNISADFACLYSNSLSDIAHFFRNNISGTQDISSLFAKYEKIWSKTLDKLIVKLEENAQN